MYRYVFVVAVLIGLGLVLRYGKTSTTLVKDIFSGTNYMVRSLALYDKPGNNP